MIRSFKLLLTALSLVVVMAATNGEDPAIGVTTSVAIFRNESKKFAVSTGQLKLAIANLKTGNKESADCAKMALKDARLHYKKIESFIEYFFVHSARIYNRAPKNEIEEPFLEYQAPIGLQYMEAMLYEDEPALKKRELAEQANILANSAADLNALLFEFKANDSQILESLRLELIRVIALGISGFDAPLSKTGIEESHEALFTMRKALLPYLPKSGNATDSVAFYLNHSIEFLKENPDFDNFDRLRFLTENALPLQQHLGALIAKIGLELNTAGILNYNAPNIFSPKAFNDSGFHARRSTLQKEQVALGQKLFSDPLLSGNTKISCASCHSPNSFFQDGLEKSPAFDPKQKVKRNAPSLLYASFQHAQFWDGRVKTLEEQIENVIRDSTEMFGNPVKIVKKLAKRRGYRKLFIEAFPQAEGNEITEQKIYRSIAAFVRTLHPYNSPFDEYLAGNKQALSQSQIHGFNLFMGKAQCGTCHFAPLFNGLIPPLYTLTEFEILGTTRTENLSKAEVDADQGRFMFRPIRFYKGAFKTPTVRNVAMTAPYMHNGAFYSLDSLMEFYNKGGGAGLGLDLPLQTLPTAPLNLTEIEKKNIISFLDALTDRPQK